MLQNQAGLSTGKFGNKRTMIFLLISLMRLKWISCYNCRGERGRLNTLTNDNPDRSQLIPLQELLMLNPSNIFCAVARPDKKITRLMVSCMVGISLTSSTFKSGSRESDYSICANRVTKNVESCSDALNCILTIGQFWKLIVKL
jgi:hypothetical protein